MENMTFLLSLTTFSQTFIFSLLYQWGDIKTALKSLLHQNKTETVQDTSY